MLRAHLVLALAPLAGAQESGRPWEDVHAWLSGEAERFAGDLEAAHAVLSERIEVEAPELRARLDPEPPAPRASGHGILPRLLPDHEPGSVKLSERTFSLKTISTAYVANVRDAAVLARRVDERSRALAPLVDELEALRDRLTNLEDHLAYHAFWQEAIVDDAEYFAERNEVVKAVRAWRDGRGRREGFEERVAPFKPVAGLQARTEADGERVLPVHVLTDVDDAEFLSAFAAAVTTAFTQSEAARSRRFRIELTIEGLSVAELYPEGMPEPGTLVDEDAHLARFPEGALVLTTGAVSTHSYVGRYVQLGSEPLTHRTLAHEFGHLLGFSDAYLRGYDGTPGDPFGARIVEWHGLLDDLMGDPARGRVTEAMIDRLIEAYAQP